MKILVNGTAYTCTGRPSLKDPVRFDLPGGQPDPASLGDVISLQDNDGNVLREITVAGFTRWYVDGTSLIGTNAPEPVETEEPEGTSDPTAQDDTDAMLVDHEYRITLLELGVTE